LSCSTTESPAARPLTVTEMLTGASDGVPSMRPVSSTPVSVEAPSEAPLSSAGEPVSVAESAASESGAASSLPVSLVGSAESAEPLSPPLLESVADESPGDVLSVAALSCVPAPLSPFAPELVDPDPPQAGMSQARATTRTATGSAGRNESSMNTSVTDTPLRPQHVLRPSRGGGLPEGPCYTSGMRVSLRILSIALAVGVAMTAAIACDIPLGAIRRSPPTGIDARVAAAHAPAPDFSLQGTTGLFHLADALSKGHVLLVFYRGHW